MARKLWVGLLLALVVSTAWANTSTVTVTPADVGTTWFTADTRPGGSSAFVVGPATPPAGVGSLQMNTTSATAKAQFFNYSYIGTALTSIDQLRYAAYRSPTSTNNAIQTISLNIEVDYNGPNQAGGFTTLVFEPYYNAAAQGAVVAGAWQSWDAYANGTAIWWSTRAIPGVCAFSCFVPWSTILASNPDATVLGGMGFNIGSGWSGVYSGNVDALTVGVSGNATTYDFEPYVVAQTQDQCKNGGWKQVKRADGSDFKNQGDCIQYVNTGK